LKRLPPWNRDQVQKFVLFAQQIFHKQGITHIREMTGSVFEFGLLQEMEKEGTLHLSVDFNFLCDRPDQLGDLLNQMGSLKSSRYVKIRGVKIFVDGSLGSETALLSQPYSGPPRDSSHRGILLWTLEEIEAAWIRVFENKFEVCFHSLGDETTHQLVAIGRKISQRGHIGRVNFEHVQVLRPETIQAMKSIHVRCHMQPVYWNTDKAWLKTKLGSLYSHAFPWEALRKSNIPLQFGSDSPIEPPGLSLNFEALESSAREGGIPRFMGDPLKYHTCPYEDVVSSAALWKNQVLEELIFDDTNILP
jgi:predicted amidohydrolase YtcJ